MVLLSLPCGIDGMLKIWNALRGLPSDATDRGADAAEPIHTPRPQIIHLLLTPRRRYVTRADLRKYGVTIVCSACSDISVHGKTSKHHTEECRNGIGEQMEHDPEGDERLQAHKRRRDAEPETEANQASVARENEGEPAHQERQDVEMPVEALAESVSCETWIGPVSRQWRTCSLRLGAEGKRGLKHDAHDVLEPQAETRARSEPRRGQKRESTQPLPELAEEVTSTIQEARSFSVDSSVATRVSVEDMAHTDVPTSTSVGTQPASSGFGHFASMKARPKTVRN